MEKAWPKPAYMSVRIPERSATNYRDETYEIITRWRADTQILYRPHAKSPGSKSHVRYETYMWAKTVGEALRLGTKPVDWCWDYERGFIKVLGPVRDEPIDICQVSDSKELTDVDNAIVRWYGRELAKKFNVSVEELFEGKGNGESLLVRAHRLVAHRGAKRRLEAADREGRWITDDEIAQTLKEWAFARNQSRQNVIPDGHDFVFSDTLGLIRDRTGSIHITAVTKLYPDFTRIINRYLSERLPPEVSSFKWTSLNLNCNYAARLHRDGNNFGPSFIKAFGDFTGGELSYWPEDDRKVDDLDDIPNHKNLKLDLSAGLAMFNGNCGHSVEDFKGTRYSVVYFTIGCFDKASEECKADLQKLGMAFPFRDENPHALLRPPKGYKRPRANIESDLPTFRYLQSEDLKQATCSPPKSARLSEPIDVTPEKTEAAPKPGPKTEDHLCKRVT
eukprot:TRINITY_DN54988_c0_g1_i1.p1 TRINITY_DN54988_c0_g1~~TRINITY_DN54988_c0_g1_i1.p1  ORF type:complete len:517 (-),score=58.41 TRINITY_DN54988_c0_g1_i1:182-1525(-)